VTGTATIDSLCVTDKIKGKIDSAYRTWHADTADKAPWAGIGGTPTTRSGYGITDAAPLTHGVSQNIIPLAISTTTWGNSQLSMPFGAGTDYIYYSGTAPVLLMTNITGDSGGVLSWNNVNKAFQIQTLNNARPIWFGNNWLTLATNGTATFSDSVISNNSKTGVSISAKDSTGNLICTGNALVDSIASVKGIKAPTGMFTNLTNWYYPLHESDTKGLVDGNIKDSLGDITIISTNFYALMGSDTIIKTWDNDGFYELDWGPFLTRSAVSTCTSNVFRVTTLEVGGSLTVENYDIAAPSIYADSCVNALVFTDRTKYYSGDAIKELRKVKGKDGQIDHATLPDFTKVIRSHIDKKTKKTIIDTTRDLGATISMLTVAVQQLSAQVDSLKAAKGGTPQGMNGNGNGLYGLIGAAALAAGIVAASLKKKSAP
jgi:hypothetical protein